MAKKTSKNNELLNSAKKTTSHKVYDLVLELVNNFREDLAEDALRVDYLLEYTSTCIKQKDLKQAKEVITKAKERIDKIKKEGYQVEYLEYLYEGISKKIK